MCSFTHTMLLATKTFQKPSIISNFSISGANSLSNSSLKSPKMAHISQFHILDPTFRFCTKLIVHYFPNYSHTSTPAIHLPQLSLTIWSFALKSFSPSKSISKTNKQTRNSLYHKFFLFNLSCYLFITKIICFYMYLAKEKKCLLSTLCWHFKRG